MLQQLGSMFTSNAPRPRRVSPSSREDKHRKCLHDKLRECQLEILLLRHTLRAHEDNMRLASTYARSTRLYRSLR